MSDNYEIMTLITGIKNTVSGDQLYKFASTALTKMSDEHRIKGLIIGIKDNISQEQLKQLNAITNYN